MFGIVHGDVRITECNCTGRSSDHAASATRDLGLGCEHKDIATFTPSYHWAASGMDIVTKGTAPEWNRACRAKNPRAMH